MGSGHEYRRRLLRLGDAAQPKKKRRALFRETLDTLVLGALSTSIGIVVLIVVIAQLRGRPLGEWFVLRTGLVPSAQCASAAVVGECLGLAGIFLARRRHHIVSPLSALGTAMCIIHMCIFLAYACYKFN